MPSSDLAQRLVQAVRDEITLADDSDIRDAAVAMLRVLNTELLKRGETRIGADEGNGPDCEGDGCVHDDCHTISAAATWGLAAAMAKRVADEIEGAA